MTYVILLRAINVGGHSIIKMGDLRKLIDSLGFSDVKTYIQTGNIIFTTKKTDIKKLAKIIEDAIVKKTDHKTTAFVLTPEQIIEACKSNPFDPDRAPEELRSHIVFLSQPPNKENIDKLMSLAGKEYRFEVREAILYYAYPKKYEGRSRRSINFEKILDVQGTARTSKVVKKLAELAN